MQASYAGIMLTGPTPSEWTGPIDMPQYIGVEIVPLVNAPRPLVRSTGNRSRTISFRAQRRYLSLVAALEARYALPDSLPDSGQLELWLETSAGDITIAAEAVLAPMPEPVLMGRTVEFGFSFAVALAGISVVLRTGLLRAETGQLLLSESGNILTI